METFKTVAIVVLLVALSLSLYAVVDMRSELNVKKSELASKTADIDTCNSYLDITIESAQTLVSINQHLLNMPREASIPSLIEMLGAMPTN